MKIKWDFVTNSSSTAYIITNKTNKKLHLLDFAMETVHLVKQFKDQYMYEGDTRFEVGPFLESATKNDIVFLPKEEKRCVFGDEQGTIVGHVYDYMLRDGGHSKSFSWKFSEHLR